jgi:hypothetical protein
MSLSFSSDMPHLQETKPLQDVSYTVSLLREMEGSVTTHLNYATEITKIYAETSAAAASV